MTGFPGTAPPMLWTPADALSQAEIQANLNLELASGSGLVARWGMNEGAGTSVADSIAPAVTGTINGINCATTNTNCPSDKLDPHIGLETGFVVMMEGGKHYLITGVSTSTLARHALEKVKVTGQDADLAEAEHDVLGDRIQPAAADRVVGVVLQQQAVGAVEGEGGVGGAEEPGRGSQRLGHALA